MTRRWCAGVGIDSSITTSALKSIISAINRFQRKR